MMLKEIATGCAIAPAVLGTYAYIGYPLILGVVARRMPRRPATRFAQWPSVTIVIPVYNEARVVADTIEHALAIDYPAELRQILVVSDASNDGTDDIVRSYASRGVELLSLKERKGKTAGENAAGLAARGDIVVNLDATIRVPRNALKELVSAFADPTVGVASGRDVTVGSAAGESNRGEGKYTSYEMRVRSLETRIHSIVGASGCFFGSRRELYSRPFPEQLSRDFGSALVARINGYRAVSVEDAVCFVPCTKSLRVERRRKVRTMARGLGTLWHMRALLNPVRFGVFSWMLFSHKVARWAVTLSAVPALAGLITLALIPNTGWVGSASRFALAGGTVLAAGGWLGFALADSGRLPRLLALPAFVAASLSAGVQAWWNALLGQQHATWAPTRRAR
jgi:glycosyltransferase involved in cell wall biosynthesis